MSKISSSNKDILTSSEACKLLKISKKTLYKLIDCNKIYGHKIGKEYRFSNEELLSYLNRPSKSKVSNLAPDLSSNDSKVSKWELKDQFATRGIQQMARRTFQEFSSNLEELIVNAYDEDATRVEVIVNKDKRMLSVIDDGNGMDENALADYVVYGKSNKDAIYKSPKFYRSPIGEYGMGGKLAISNLCKECIVITKRNGSEHSFKMGSKLLESAEYISDVKRIVYTKSCPPDLHGTAIHMTNLHYRNIDIDRLKDRFAMKMPKSQNFKIYLTIVQSENTETEEIEDPKFEYDQVFEYQDHLELIGEVDLKIYFTSVAIPVSKQGVWTKVNGRIVNEKQEWFGLLSLKSGHRYKYRIYGIANADGLKNCVTFSKNDFIDGPEYQEYYQFVQKNLKKVQDALLKVDEDAKKQMERKIVKNVEEYINKVVSKLETPDMMKKLATKLKKVFSEHIEDAPNTPYPELKKVEDEISQKVDNIVKRGKDRQSRRNRTLQKSDQLSYSGKGYVIETVDMSEEGDLVLLKEDVSTIEINEKHRLYSHAAKNGYLNSFIRDLAFMEIARDYCGDNITLFDSIYNEIVKISLDIELQ
ncbi:MAG: ATP-binding protein [Pseudomonadota bacterium]